MENEQLTRLLNDLGKKAADDTWNKLELTIKLALSAAPHPATIICIIKPVISALLDGAALVWHDLDAKPGEPQIKKPSEDDRLMIALLCASYGIKTKEDNQSLEGAKDTIAKQFKALTGKEFKLPAKLQRPGTH